MEVPKFSQLGLPRLWGPITLCVDIQLRWGLKQSYSPFWQLFNGFSYTTCTQGNLDDSRLLMVGSQIANLTFGYNLWIKCPNRSCELILDIYVPRDFQWYKELHNPMGFDLFNWFLKIQKSTGTPTPKVRVHLGMWGFILSHSLAPPGAWNVILGLHTWLAPSQALALVTSPRLGLHNCDSRTSRRQGYNATIPTISTFQSSFKKDEKVWCCC